MNKKALIIIAVIAIAAISLGFIIPALQPTPIVHEFGLKDEFAFLNSPRIVNTVSGYGTIENTQEHTVIQNRKTAQISFYITYDLNCGALRSTCTGVTETDSLRIAASNSIMLTNIIYIVEASAATNLNIILSFEEQVQFTAIKSAQTVTHTGSMCGGLMFHIDCVVNATVLFTVSESTTTTTSSSTSTSSTSSSTTSSSTTTTTSETPPPIDHSWTDAQIGQWLYDNLLITYYGQGDLYQNYYGGKKVVIKTSDFAMVQGDYIAHFVTFSITGIFIRVMHGYLTDISNRITAGPTVASFMSQGELQVLPTNCRAVTFSAASQIIIATSSGQWTDFNFAITLSMTFITIAGN